MCTVHKDDPVTRDRNNYNTQHNIIGMSKGKNKFRGL